MARAVRNIKCLVSFSVLEEFNITEIRVGAFDDLQCDDPGTDLEHPDCGIMTMYVHLAYKKTIRCTLIAILLWLCSFLGGNALSTLPDGLFSKLLPTLQEVYVPSLSSFPLLLYTSSTLPCSRLNSNELEYIPRDTFINDQGNRQCFNDL